MKPIGEWKIPSGHEIIRKVEANSNSLEQRPAHHYFINQSNLIKTQRSDIKLPSEPPEQTLIRGQIVCLQIQPELDHVGRW